MTILPSAADFARLCLCVSFAGLLFATASPVPTGKPTTYPDWWFERDVIPRLPSLGLPTTLPPMTTPPPTSASSR
jgi:hypothetical protein